tara:strand:+ start:170 stop:511 length:342 start_codon:yes stop_codon:yes gene_type:complete
MSDFFDSDIVKEGLQEINELQSQIYGNSFKFGAMNYEDKINHIEKLTHLLEKQKLMFTRISLSKDPEAIALKEHLEQSVQLLGFPEGTDMSLLFSGMSHTIDNLKTQLDNNDE